jgi:hypothetical protein
MLVSFQRQKRFCPEVLQNELSHYRRPLFGAACDMPVVPGAVAHPKVFGLSIQRDMGAPSLYLPKLSVRIDSRFGGEAVPVLRPERSEPVS